MLAATLKQLPLVAFILLAACSLAPSPLIDDLIEGMHESDAVAVLGLQRAAFQVLHETSVPKGDPRSPYSEKTIAAAAALCAGQPSEILLSFYLDQLREVTCFPNDVRAMSAALKSRGVIDRDERTFSYERGGIVIRGNENGGRWGVTFSSQRITAAQRNWIAENS